MSIKAQDGLKRLRRELMRRSQTIKRGASLLSIHFGPVRGDHSFAVVTWWHEGGKTMELTKTIKFTTYFKTDGSLMVRPCELARQIIQDILTRRGI